MPTVYSRRPEGAQPATTATQGHLAGTGARLPARRTVG